MIARPRLDRMWEAFLPVTVQVAKPRKSRKGRDEDLFAASKKLYAEARRKHPGDDFAQQEFVRKNDVSGSEAVRRDALDGPEVAAAILRCVRDQVLPAVRRLECLGAIDWYAFLFHDRSGGVPTVEGDGGAYVHLRVSMVDASSTANLSWLLPPSWKWVRSHVDGQPAFYTDRIAGVKLNALAGEEISRAWGLLGELSKWYLDFLEQHGPTFGDDPRDLQQLGQFLHFFSNMTRMRVG